MSWFDELQRVSGKREEPELISPPDYTAPRPFEGDDTLGGLKRRYYNTASSLASTLGNTGAAADLEVEAAGVPRRFNSWRDIDPLSLDVFDYVQQTGGEQVVPMGLMAAGSAPGLLAKAPALARAGAGAVSSAMQYGEMAKELRSIGKEPDAATVGVSLLQGGLDVFGLENFGRGILQSALGEQIKAGAAASATRRTLRGAALGGLSTTMSELLPELAQESLAIVNRERLQPGYMQGSPSEVGARLSETAAATAAFAAPPGLASGAWGGLRAKPGTPASTPASTPAPTPPVLAPEPPVVDQAPSGVLDLEHSTLSVNARGSNAFDPESGRIVLSSPTPGTTHEEANQASPNETTEQRQEPPPLLTGQDEYVEAPSVSSTAARPAVSTAQPRTHNLGDIPYAQHVQDAAEAYGLDPYDLAAIMHQESRGHQAAVSPKGAAGLMQLMPETAKEMGVTDPFDPRQNIFGGARYYSRMLKRYGGNKALALAAYNAGPGRVNLDGSGAWRRIPETVNYVNTIMRHIEQPGWSPRMSESVQESTPRSSLGSAVTSGQTRSLDRNAFDEETTDVTVEAPVFEDMPNASVVGQAYDSDGHELIKDAAISENPNVFRTIISGDEGDTKYSGSRVSKAFSAIFPNSVTQQKTDGPTLYHVDLDLDRASARTDADVERLQQALNTSMTDEGVDITDRMAQSGRLVRRAKAILEAIAGADKSDPKSKLMFLHDAVRGDKDKTKHVEVGMTRAGLTQLGRAVSDEQYDNTPQGDYDAAVDGAAYWLTQGFRPADRFRTVANKDGVKEQVRISDDELMRGLLGERPATKGSFNTLNPVEDYEEEEAKRAANAAARLQRDELTTYDDEGNPVNGPTLSAPERDFAGDEFTNPDFEARQADTPQGDAWDPRQSGRREHPVLKRLDERGPFKTKAEASAARTAAIEEQLEAALAPQIKGFVATQARELADARYELEQTGHLRARPAWGGTSEVALDWHRVGDKQVATARKDAPSAGAAARNDTPLSEAEIADALAKLQEQQAKDYTKWYNATRARLLQTLKSTTPEPTRSKGKREWVFKHFVPPPGQSNATTLSEEDVKELKTNVLLDAGRATVKDARNESQSELTGEEGTEDLVTERLVEQSNALEQKGMDDRAKQFKRDADRLRKKITRLKEADAKAREAKVAEIEADKRIAPEYKQDAIRYAMDTLDMEYSRKIELMLAGREFEEANLIDYFNELKQHVSRPRVEGEELITTLDRDVTQPLMLLPNISGNTSEAILERDRKDAATKGVKIKVPTRPVPVEDVDNPVLGNELRAVTGSVLATNVPRSLAMIVNDVLHHIGLNIQTRMISRGSIQAHIDALTEQRRDLYQRTVFASHALARAKRGTKTKFQADLRRAERNLRELDHEIGKLREAQDNPTWLFRAIYNDHYTLAENRVPIILVGDIGDRPVNLLPAALAHEVGHVVQRAWFDQLKPEEQIGIINELVSDGGVDEKALAEAFANRFAEWYATRRKLQTTSNAARKAGKWGRLEQAFHDFHDMLKRIWEDLRAMGARFADVQKTMLDGLDPKDPADRAVLLRAEATEFAAKYPTFDEFLSTMVGFGGNMPDAKLWKNPRWRQLVFDPILAMPAQQRVKWPSSNAELVAAAGDTEAGAFAEYEAEGETQSSINRAEGDIWSMEGVPVVTTNLGGVHGRGLAKQAKDKGLITPTNRDFASSPKHGKVITLAVKGRAPETAKYPGRAFSERVTGGNLDLLRDELNALVEHARAHPEQRFLLPYAGLGFGEGDADAILPMLEEAAREPNIVLVSRGEDVAGKYPESFVPGVRRDATTRAAQLEASKAQHPTFEITRNKKMADVSGMRSNAGEGNMLTVEPGQPGWLGNPYKWEGNTGPKGVTREEVVSKFKAAFLRLVEGDEKFRNAVLALRGKKVHYYSDPAGSHIEVVQQWLASQPEATQPSTPSAPSPQDQTLALLRQAFPASALEYDDAAHAYKVNGKVLPSVTQLKSLLDVFKFDAEGVALRMAGGDKEAAKRIQDSWKADAEEGTAIHKALEKALADPTDTSVHQSLRDLAAKLKARGMVLSEVPVWDGEKAGTIDVLVVRPDGRLEIYDLKTLVEKHNPHSLSSEYERKYKGGESKAEGHRLQLLMYGDILSQAGGSVAGTYVIPVRRDSLALMQRDDGTSVVSARPSKTTQDYFRQIKAKLAESSAPTPRAEVPADVADIVKRGKELLPGILARTAPAPFHDMSIDEFDQRVRQAASAAAARAQRYASGTRVAQFAVVADYKKRFKGTWDAMARIGRTVFQADGVRLRNLADGRFAGVGNIIAPPMGKRMDQIQMTAIPQAMSQYHLPNGRTGQGLVGTLSINAPLHDLFGMERYRLREKHGVFALFRDVLALRESDPAAYDNLLENLWDEQAPARSVLAQSIRNFYKDMLEDLIVAGLDFGDSNGGPTKLNVEPREGYFTKMPDIDKMLAEEADVIEAFTKAYQARLDKGQELPENEFGLPYATAREAAEAQHYRTVTGNYDDVFTDLAQQRETGLRGPAFPQARSRPFSNEEYQQFGLTRWLERDIAKVISTYLDTSARRAATQRAFGFPRLIRDNKRSRAALTERFLAARLDPSLINTPMAAIELLIHEAERDGLLNRDGVKEVYTLIRSALGQLNVGRSPRGRRWMNRLVAYETLNTMSGSALMQLSDFGINLWRGENLGRDLGNLAKLFDGTTREQQRKILEMLGMAADHMAQHAYLTDIGTTNDPLAEGSRKVTEFMFKYNGMQKLSEYSMMLASIIGQDYMRDYARQATNATLPQAQRDKALGRLKELHPDLTPDDVLNGDLENDIRPDRRIRLRYALRRYINTSHIHDQHGYTSQIFNDWRFKPLTMLKGFMMKFHNIVLKLMWERMKEQPDLRHAVMPFVTLAICTMPLAAMGLYAKDLVRRKIPAAMGFKTKRKHKDRTPEQWIHDSFMATGMGGMYLGVMDSMFEAPQHGMPALVALGGPPITHGYTMMTRTADEWVPASIPGLNIFPAAKSGLRSELRDTFGWGVRDDEE